MCCVLGEFELKKKLIILNVVESNSSANFYFIYIYSSGYDIFVAGSLSKEEKKTFCKRLFDIKLPDGYGSTIGNCILIDECKIKGLKSHDYHILIQQLLTVALRGLLPKGPRFAIFQLSAYFNELCWRVIDGAKLEEMENDIAETLCMLERFFPPFFDIMIHLTIHLGREAQRCAPVQYRWMYHFKRCVKLALISWFLL